MEPEYPAATKLITTAAEAEKARVEASMSERPAPGGIFDLIFGSLAGMNGKVIEYPFDTVKVRLQTTRNEVFSGTFDCLRQTFKEEGFKGFYRGLSSPLVGAMAENALAFFSYNRIQGIIRLATSTPADAPLSIPQLFAAGAFAGSAGSLVLTPIELVKCKLQVENVQSYGGSAGQAAAKTIKYAGPISVVKSILRTKGIAGLYYGFGPTLARESLGGGFWFGTYEAVCRVSLKYKERRLREVGDARTLTKSDLSPLTLILAGGMAGVAYNTSSYPIDVIKSYIQTADVRGVQQSQAQSSSSKSIWVDVARKVYQGGGIRAFYRGLGITLVRAFPANAIMFMTYEYLSRASAKFTLN